MKIEITDDRKNPLLNRREIQGRLSYIGATPKLLDIKKELVGILKADANLTIVDTIDQEYGTQVATVYAKVYDDEKSMTVERSSNIKKNAEPKEEKTEGSENE